MVYARLLQYLGKNGSAWPAYETLATETGISRRQVINVVKQLERLELLKVRRRGRQVNYYQLPPHPWAKSSGEKISPVLVKPSSPGGEARCTTTGEAGFTQREKPKTTKERTPRERWQIDNDIKSATKQRNELFEKLRRRYQRDCIGDGQWRDNMFAKAEKKEPQAVEDTRKYHRIEDELERLDQERWQ